MVAVGARPLGDFDGPADIRVPVRRRGGKGHGGFLLLVGFLVYSGYGGMWLRKSAAGLGVYKITDG
jgi:hypothetical protein